MAAAPHLFDDAPLASPELALVDADLAAQLRADMPAGEAFQPRAAARPELTLVFDAVVRDVAEDASIEIATAVDDVDEDPVAERGELSDLVAPTADLGPDEDAVSDVDDDPQTEPEARSADALASPALEALSTVDEDPFELPDYIVVSDTTEAVPEYVVQPEAEDAPPLPVDSEDVGPNDELVPHDVALPDYVVQPETEDSVAPAVHEAVDVMPDYVVRDDVVQDEVGEGSADDPDGRSTYPVLPDLDERSDALEETDAALRRIREQLVVPPTAQPLPRVRVRRRFTVVAALFAVAAVATAAAELQLGVMHAPGFLAF